MLHFFRKVRGEYLKKDNIKKYLLYALGEIILVVIGILIALQINNLNEVKKHQRELNNIYSVIIKDLENDIEDVTDILTDNENREWIFKNVFDDLMTKEVYEEAPFSTRIITGYEDLTVEENGYNLLKNHMSNTDVSNDSLKMEILQFYKKQIVELEADIKIRENDLENNYTDWKNNYTWFADFITYKDNSGFIDYALNNPDYKNRAANFYVLNYRIYGSRLKDFNKEAKIIIEKISQYLNNIKD